MTHTFKTETVYLKTHEHELACDLMIEHVGISVTVPGESNPMDRRIHDILHYVVRGKGIFRSNGKEYHLQAGNLYLMPKNTVVSYEADKKDPWIVCYVGFYGKKADYYLEQLNLSPDNVAIYRQPDQQLFEYYQAMHKEIVQKSPSLTTLVGYLYIILGVLLKWMNVDENIAEPEDIFAVVKNFIGFNLDHPLRVSEISQNFHISQSQLFRIFKQNTGLSTQQYIEEEKMSRACRLLENDRCSIQEIAEQCGYEYMSHFYKTFTKYMKITPAAYRIKKKNESSKSTADESVPAEVNSLTTDSGC